MMMMMMMMMIIIINKLGIFPASNFFDDGNRITRKLFYVKATGTEAANNDIAKQSSSASCYYHQLHIQREYNFKPNTTYTDCK